MFADGFIAVMKEYRYLPYINGEESISRNQTRSCPSLRGFQKGGDFVFQVQGDEVDIYNFLIGKKKIDRKTFGRSK